MVRAAQEAVNALGRGLVAAALFATLGCSKSDAQPSPAPSATTAKTATGGTPLVLASGVRFIKPEGGDASAVVKREMAREAADGRTVIVYVGATWCDPCRRFHAAAQRGELDAEFPKLSIVEFDADHDRDRIGAAGYRSTYIPLFVKPDASGRASAARFEGSVKGDHAIADITGKLKKLIAGEKP